MRCESAFWEIFGYLLGFSLGLIPLILVFWGLFFGYLLVDQRWQARWREEDRQLREAQRRS
jgi:hypothetical protein